jgi:uncharacterized protein involved in type VI secretion and phage assembly
MLPQTGDEVVIGFEHDDVRKPYVLGSIWNGKGQPGDKLAHKDGSFGLQSDKQIVISAKDNISIKSAKDLTIETDGNISQKPSGDFEIEGGKTVSIKAQTSVTIEAQADLTIKAASLSLKATGVVQISGSQITLG